NNCKSQSRSPFRTTSTFVRPVKALKDMRKMFRVDAFTEIAYISDHSFFADIEADNHFVRFRGMIDRIGTQVGHHLADTMSIGIHRDLAHGPLNLEFNPLLRGFDPELIKDIDSERVQVYLTHMHLYLTGLNVGKCQQVLNEHVEAIKAT